MNLPNPLPEWWTPAHQDRLNWHDLGSHEGRWLSTNESTAQLDDDLRILGILECRYEGKIAYYRLNQFTPNDA